jgi:hypothetical protein
MRKQIWRNSLDNIFAHFLLNNGGNHINEHLLKNKRKILEHVN